MYLNNRVLVIDGFYEDPDKVRNLALAEEFYPCTHPMMRGNYPGLRTRFLNHISEDLCQEFRDNMMGNLLDGLSTKYNCYFETNFQLCYPEHGDSWLHTDRAPWPVTHVGVVYLNPNPPPNSGTLMYELRPEYAEDFKDYCKRYDNLWKKLNRDQDKTELNTWFELTLSIPNRYNRAIMYSPQAFHKSDTYFGSTPETGRLIQPFFATITYE